MKLKSAIWAVLLAVGASGFTLRADTVKAIAEQVNGNVYATDASGKSKKLKTGDTITVGSLIHTNVDSSVRLKLVPGAKTVMTPGTDVVLTTLDYSQVGDNKTRKIKLTLNSGEILCSLAKHDGHSDFRVVTPQGTTKAVGTDWAVSFTPSAGVAVATADGTVIITLPNNKTVTVPGGQVVTSADGVTTVTGTLTAGQIAKITNVLGGGNEGVEGTFNILPVNTNNSNPSNTSRNPSISPTE